MHINVYDKYVVDSSSKANIATTCVELLTVLGVEEVQTGAIPVLLVYNKRWVQTVFIDSINACVRVD